MIIISENNEPMLKKGIGFYFVFYYFNWVIVFIEGVYYEKYK
jgi:hypothetical protein